DPCLFQSQPGQATPFRSSISTTCQSAIAAERRPQCEQNITYGSANMPGSDLLWRRTPCCKFHGSWCLQLFSRKCQRFWPFYIPELANRRALPRRRMEVVKEDKLIRGLRSPRRWPPYYRAAFLLSGDWQ